MGLPTAWFIATRPPRERTIWLFLVTIPFWTNLLIRTYAMAEANVLQPFSYLQLAFASVLAVAFLGERLEAHVAIGATIVVAAGTFTLVRGKG